MAFFFVRPIPLSGRVVSESERGLRRDCTCYVVAWARCWLPGATSGEQFVISQYDRVSRHVPDVNADEFRDADPSSQPPEKVKASAPGTPIGQSEAGFARFPGFGGSGVP